ncbi:flagellar motor protein MotB [Sedimenticola selenatireducens]|uniref:OmpA family protein n=1 Tax=Sedimenticola selenatireducens TaxID=191960 RepID=A0A557SCR5_9GAMM|nr:flagellar motor protein MotB [Sedimenticola selenatireducens]TVO75218.1 OmpA family protein [Sedimenticola selenatireducens]TVT66928.1 MAG: OmpA family protein [Sedimenticola selenatireducens]
MSDDCPKCDAGLPPWLATFADLMSLLMCFFVLLLSFAEIDAIRFKKMADSMKDAFGVQREVQVTDIVMGTSVIKQEFSPSTIPEPSLVDEVRQQTTDVEKQHLDVPDAASKSEAEVAAEAEAEAEAAEEAAAEAAEKLMQEIAQQAEEIKEAMQLEIEEKLVTVETQQAKIIIRINEKGSFPSGSAKLNDDFYGVMVRLSEAVAKTPGKVVVAGHSDDVPISTNRFRSNWELSSARAVTVVHALLDDPNVDPGRVKVEGHADSQPLVPNDSRENRAINRRVELIIERGSDVESGEALAIPPAQG